MEIVILAVVIAVVVLGAISGLVVSGRKKKQLPPSPPATPATPSVTAPPAEPQVGEEAETPSDEERRTIEEVGLPAAEAPVAAPEAQRLPRRSRSPSRPRADWCACAPGSPARRTPWARAC